jgi:transcriptional regulator with XRE-family HTH domain
VNSESAHEKIHQGQVVAQYRKALKWSQEDLAEALRIDVRTVQRMEKQVMIRDLSRRRLLVGLLGIPAVLMGWEHEVSPVQQLNLLLNYDRMALFEEEMTARWDLYFTGGTLRAARGLDLWIHEMTQFAKSSQGTAWHERALALLTMSYQLQSCVLRDLMDYPNAYAAARRAYRIAQELDDTELMAAALARTGITFVQQENPAEAIRYLNGALKTIYYQGFPVLKGYILQALSEAYAMAQQPHACWQSIGQLEHVLEQYEQVQERSNTRFNTASFTAQKGIDALLLHDYRRALALMEKSFHT